MTQEKARKLIKIAKYALIALFTIFFVIILVQSIQISQLKGQQSLLQNEFNQKQAESITINSQIDNINSNFDKYSEEELRKEGYIKDGEIYFK